LNQNDITAKPQDDYQKQKANKKSWNWQKVMISLVENKNPEGYLGVKFQFILKIGHPTNIYKNCSKINIHLYR